MINKTLIKRNNVEQRDLTNFLKVNDQNIIVLNEIGETYQVPADNIPLPNSFWKVYEFTLSSTPVGIYSFQVPTNIKNNAAVWQVQIALNGLELAYSEMLVSQDKRTITLNLSNGITLETGDKLKISYISE
jgi:DNA/RNA endonuclease G (NUC1)